MFQRKIIVSMFLGVLFTASGCHTGKQVSAVAGNKVLLGERSKGWLKYQVYLLPNDSARKVANNPDYMRLSIMVINMENNTSPLRRLCTSLDDYNGYYEYLLNHCKEDITVSAGGALLYPVSYSFENNYNAFPFETINVGYRYGIRKKKHSTDVLLTYNDKVFSHDTINFNLNYIKK
ncbi:hypothetical protein ACTHGU_03665 [Chitinophagaceae bacterium MMS25-I14]